MFLALSALQKYDNRPFVVCIVTPVENFMLLANSTFLSKISHSSQKLRTNNIRGSFNGSDIMRSIEGIENRPENFETLFMMHESFAFTENLERLVERTNAIAPTGKRFDPSDDENVIIRDAPIRAGKFLVSNEYIDLRDDLGERIKSVQKEIAIAAFIDNMNIRGRIIEYLITSDSIKAVLCSAFDKQLLDGTVTLFHWAGRNSKGVTQFMGSSLLEILNNPKYSIDMNQANTYVEKFLSL